MYGEVSQNGARDYLTIVFRVPVERSMFGSHPRTSELELAFTMFQVILMLL